MISTLVLKLAFDILMHWKFDTAVVLAFSISQKGRAQTFATILISNLFNVDY